MQSHGKTRLIIFLIFIPSIIGICVYIYGYYYFGSLSANHYIDLSSNQTIFIALVSALLCYILIIIHGVYPIILTIKKYVIKEKS